MGTKPMAQHLTQA